MLDVTKGVPDGILEVATAEPGDEGQRLLAARAGPPVIAKQGMEPARIVEHLGLTGLVADGLDKAKRLFVMTEGVGVAALSRGCPRRIGVSAPLLSASSGPSSPNSVSPDTG